METIAVVGAGLIGRAWAIVFARAGHQAVLYDAVEGAAQKALGAIDLSLADLASAGLLNEPPAAVRARMAVAESLSDALHEAGWAIESLPETEDIKRQIFADMDAAAPEATILMSSTSTIPASRFTEDLHGRSRCLVAHPVNPPYLVPLVELVPAPWTDPDVVTKARAFFEAVGQVPIVVKKEIQAFILNRLQGALLSEAFRLVEDGYVSTADCDKVIADGLGMRWAFMGPFETIDLNAPGGVADYIARYGGLYYELAQQATPRRWEAPLTAQIEAERREVLSADQLAARQAWRDRRLMALLAHKRDAAKTIR